MVLMINRMQRQTDQSVTNAIHNNQEQDAMADRDKDVGTTMRSRRKTNTENFKPPSEFSSEDVRNRRRVKRNKNVKK